MEASNDNGNGRVTLAEIKKDISYLIEQLKTQTAETREYRQRLEERIRCLETVQATHTTEIGNLKDEQAAQRKKSDVWDSINSAAAIVAGIFAGLSK